MPDVAAILARIQTHWVYGGVLGGLLILALAPVLAAGWTTAELLVFLTLPAYMLHQFEEHDADRFRQFVNREVFKGAEALTILDVFLINIPGVWGVLAITIWLNQSVAAGWGMIGVGLVLVNSMAHIAQAVVLRRANPGLWTAILIFVPVGIAALMALWPLATMAQTLLSFALAVLIHAVIILRMRGNLAGQP